MTITYHKIGEALNVSIDGRLDTNTAPELSSFFAEHLSHVTKVMLNLENLTYISSAGLRVLLSAHKKMSGVGTVTLTNVSDAVMEVFEITGFADILTIQ